MKVIDLLNKIANGEEVPKKIKYCGVDYYWTGFNYENSEADEVLFWTCIYSEKYINDEVEIIEDKPQPKPITKKDLEALGYAFGEMRKALQKGWNKSLNNEPFKEDKKIEKLESFGLANDNPMMNKVIALLANKIDEIIDYLNKEE